MRQSSVNEIYRIKRNGIRSEQDKKNLWIVYKDAFGTVPDGSMECSLCVTDSFWKVYEHVKKNHYHEMENH